MTIDFEHAYAFERLDNNSLETFKDPHTHVVVYPPALKSGELIYPFH